jgi:hypothetical protein
VPKGVAKLTENPAAIPPENSMTSTLDQCLAAALGNGSRAARLPFVTADYELGPIPTGVMHPNAKGTVALFGPAIVDAIKPMLLQSIAN